MTARRLDSASRSQRDALVALARRYHAAGWMLGTSGNLSARFTGMSGPAVVITASGLDMIGGATQIVTLFDPDKAGDNARSVVSKWAWKKAHVRHIYLHRPNDGSKALDAGDYDPLVLAEIIGNHLTLDDIVID